MQGLLKIQGFRKNYWQVFNTRRNISTVAYVTRYISCAGSGGYVLFLAPKLNICVCGWAGRESRAVCSDSLSFCLALQVKGLSLQLAAGHSAQGDEQKSKLTPQITWMPSKALASPISCFLPIFSTFTSDLLLTSSEAFFDRRNPEWLWCWSVFEDWV